MLCSIVIPHQVWEAHCHMRLTLRGRKRSFTAKISQSLQTQFKTRSASNTKGATVVKEC